MRENAAATVGFLSQFKPYMTGLIAEKRGMGHKYTATAGILRLFDEFVVENGFSDHVITKGMLETWSSKRPHESDKTHRTRFWAVQQLSRYMVRMGLPSYVSPFEMKAKKSGFRPYIFTDAELERFLKCADELVPTALSPTRHLVFPMLFRLLICSGLRLNEALKLQRQDISFVGETVILSIYRTKFDKDRLVPLAPALSRKLQQYLTSMELLQASSDYVFPTKDGGRYALNTVYVCYRDVLWSAGISHGGRGVGPRIHDFRHSFTVKSLRKMALSNMDMMASLPLLCKYLGHKNIYSTQTYFSLTAEVFPHITSDMEAIGGKIIPMLEEQYE